MIRHERSASHRINKTAPSDTAAVEPGVLCQGGELRRRSSAPARFAAPAPDSRRRASSRCAAAAIASVAARPGSQRVIIEHRLDLDKAAQIARARARLPLARARQEKAPAGRPARLRNVSAGHVDRPGQRIERISAVGDARSGPVDSAIERAAQARIGAQRAEQRRRPGPWPAISRRPARRQIEQARCARKNRRPAVPATERKCSWSAASAAASLAAAGSASSGVGASTTTRCRAAGKRSHIVQSALRPRQSRAETAPWCRSRAGNARWCRSAQKAQDSSDAQPR